MTCAWSTFTFYYGRLTGWRYTVAGKPTHEVIPTNGRAGWWDVMEVDDDGESEWVGESFTSLDEAKRWVDGT